MEEEKENSDEIQKQEEQEKINKKKTAENLATIAFVVCFIPYFLLLIGLGGVLTHIICYAVSLSLIINAKKIDEKNIAINIAFWIIVLKIGFEAWLMLTMASICGYTLTACTAVG